MVNIDVSSYKGQDVKLVFRHYNCTDIFYVGIDDVTITQSTLAVSDSQKNQIKIYPNPSSDFITIENVEDLKTVRIFDLTGKLVKQTQAKEINIQNFAKGQYIMNVYTGNEIVSRKFIKK